MLSQLQTSTLPAASTTEDNMLRRPYAATALLHKTSVVCPIFFCASSSHAGTISLLGYLTVRLQFCRGASAFKVYKPLATRPAAPGTSGLVAGQAALPARSAADKLQGVPCPTPGAPQSSCRVSIGAWLCPLTRQ